jgi:TetR/AcrR family transcriptional repressor of nem operon
MMPRIVNKDEFAARRNEILDAAQRLVYTKGYEQMSIQDILDSLGISKGAFYHYFSSKGEVLDKLVERMVVEEVVPLLESVVGDPHLSAIEKLHRYFDTAVRWKSQRKAFMLQLLRVWLSDENAIVRQKLLNMSIEHVTPLLTEIIRQGVREGVFKTAYPDQTCQVIIYTLQGLSGTILELLISDETNRDPARVRSAVTAYAAALNDATERLLGAPRDSMHLLDLESLEAWFAPQETLLGAPQEGSPETHGDSVPEQLAVHTLQIQEGKER